VGREEVRVPGVAGLREELGVLLEDLEVFLRGVVGRGSVLAVRAGRSAGLTSRVTASPTSRGLGKEQSDMRCRGTQLWYPSGAAGALPWKWAASMLRSWDEAGLLLGRYADMTVTVAIPA
jgi:hypothetical protein